MLTIKFDRIEKLFRLPKLSDNSNKFKPTAELSLNTSLRPSMIEFPTEIATILFSTVKRPAQYGISKA